MSYYTLVTSRLGLIISVVLNASLVASLFTEVKKQAEMADDLQTQHCRRLVHSYFHQWTEKTRQMQRAKELHDKTVLKRSVDT